MEENSVWIIGIITLAAGALIGYLLGRTSDSSGKQQKLIDQLNESQRELSEYKEQVNGHFEKTAELVNNLTESYKAVHQHLAQGSEALCMGEHSPTGLDSNSAARIEEQPETETQSSTTTEQPEPVQQEVIAEPEESEMVVAPPLDYAPKAPDQEGTLSENYGVKKKNEDDMEDDIPVLRDHVPADAVATGDKEKQPV